MNNRAENFLLFGQSDSLPETVSLRAGPLTMFYDPAAGDLRYIRFGGALVLLRIYAAVRDRNWGTIPGRLREVERTVREDSFRIAYESVHRSGNIDFRWHGEISGEKEGALQFRFDGQAHSTFLKNRIGFCVLHPLDCAGTPARAEYISGDVAVVTLPELVAAEQPVRGLHDLRAIRHAVTSDVWAEVRVEGDSFETEDQRNWIDASFKTFCTPQRIPFPVQVNAGHQVRQSISLRLITPDTRAGNVRQTTDRERDIISLELRDALGPVPTIGFGASSGGERIAQHQAETLRFVKPKHVRVDVDFCETSWPQQFAAGCAEADALNCKLELALHVDAQRDERALAQLLERIGPDLVARVVVYSEGKKTTDAAAFQLVRRMVPSTALVGVGTNADFYQLNQCRPPHADADFVAWSMNPQAHAFDLASLAETPTAIPAQISSARRYFDGKPIVITPVTLRPRFNPVATGPEPPVPPGELPPQVDPRQLSMFGAAWTLAAVKYLIEAQVESATFYETVGWRGLIEGSTIRAPDRFPSRAHQVFPLFHVFADIAEFSEGSVVRSVSSDPIAVNVLAIQSAVGLRLLIANLSDRPRQVRLPARRGRAQILEYVANDDAFFAPARFRAGVKDAAWPDELELAPFSVLRLDLKS